MRARHFLFVLLLTSCSVEENTPTKPVNESFDSSGATLIASGMFTGTGGHTVMGMASIYEKDGVRTLVLDPFNSSNGPDLRVYLSRDENASSALNLGFLKSVAGKQLYSIPASAIISEFTYVHIWCQQFSVEFGRAPLD